MNVLSVLRMVRSLGGDICKIYLVGCEPADMGGDEGHMGLSHVVEAALDDTVNRIEALVNRILDEKKI